MLDIKQNQLSGFHKFHDRLTPSIEERASRQALYRDLLCHKTAHVAKFALTALGKLEKAGKLEIAPFIHEVSSIFYLPVKGNAIAALKFIKRIIKAHPHYSEQGLNISLEGLRHENPDVQAQTLDLLEHHAQHLTPEIKQTLADAAGYLPASLQHRLPPLTDNVQDSATEQREQTPDVAGLKSRLQQLSTTQRQALGLSESFLDDDFVYPSLSDNILDHQLLPVITPMTPIASRDELIHAVSHAVEHVDSADEIERILDGLSRFCNDRGDDFNEKTSPLLHRLDKGDDLQRQEGITNGYGGLRLAIADLLLSWLKNTYYHSPDGQFFSAVNAFKPAISRINQLTIRVVDRKPLPLLAMPTHSGGWIDPVVWLSRLQSYEDHQWTFDRADFVLSLLRLTPDHRPQALQLSKQLNSPIQNVVNFALGGNALPRFRDRKNYDFWVAAARCRDPYADWHAVFKPLKLNDPWPDSSQPGKCQWRAYQKEHTRAYGKGKNKHVEHWKTPQLEIDISTRDQPDHLGTNKAFIHHVGEKLSQAFSTDWKRLPCAALN